MSLPALTLTRPAAQAQAWAQALASLGVPTRCLPLITTTAIAGVQAKAREQAAASHWVFFTSPAAVTALFDGGWAWPSGASACCVGPGTAAALRDAGVPSERLLSPPPDAEQFDSERLWPLLRDADDWPHRRVLWLCGEGGRDWLIQRLRESGAQVDLLPVYRRGAPALTPAALQEAIAAPGLWLFSSSEAIANLQQLAPATDWSRLHGLATHPRIVERAARLGLHCELVSPQVDAVADAWRNWVAAAGLRASGAS